MIKAGRIDAISERTGPLRPETAIAVEIIVVLLKETLQWGESMHIVRFGRFTVRQRDPSAGRNPHTGQAVLITTWQVVTLKGSKHPCDLVNREGIPRTCSGPLRGGHGCVWTLRLSTHPVAHTMTIHPHAWVTYGLQSVIHVPHS